MAKWLCGIFDEKTGERMTGQMIDSITGEGPQIPCMETDGLKKQVVLLQEISRELDHYFAVHILGNEPLPEPEKTGSLPDNHPVESRVLNLPRE